MQGLRLTSRGKAVVAILVITASLGINHLIAGKALACDWRAGVSPCEQLRMEAP